MKRTLTSLTICAVLLLGATHQANAQAVNLKDLQKKIEKSDKRIQDAKRAAKYSTWMDRGELMLDVYHKQQLNAFNNMSLQEFALLVGKPTSQREEKIDSVTYLVLSMPTVDFFFNSEQKLYFYRLTQPLVARPLDSCYHALTRAYELDTKKKKSDKIIEQLKFLRTHLLNEGVNFQVQGDYANAIHDFNLGLQIGELPYVQMPDSALYYYVGLTYFLNKQFHEAANMFKQAIEHKYNLNGELYCYYFQAMDSAGDAKTGKEFLLEGMRETPGQQCIVIHLIQYTLKNNEDPAFLIELVDKRLAEDPNNHILYFVKGIAFDELRRYDESEQMYWRTVELQPDFTDALYNIAVQRYNRGQAAIEEANKLPTRGHDKEYDELSSLSRKLFRDAIDPAEKILAIDPDHRAALDLLRGLYFRFRTEPEMKRKHEAVCKKLGR